METSFLGWAFAKSGMRGSGERWHCSLHKSGYPTIRLLPVSAGGKERWRCDKCGAWGDLHDLLRDKFPTEDFSERQDRIKRWKAEYEAEVRLRQPFSLPFGMETQGEKVCRWVLLGIPHDEWEEIRSSRFGNSPRQIEQAMNGVVSQLRELELGESYALQLLKLMNEQCRIHKVSPSDLETLWQEQWETSIEMAEEHHASECDDVECCRPLCVEARLKRIVDLAEKKRKRRKSHHAHSRTAKQRR